MQTQDFILEGWCNMSNYKLISVGRNAKTVKGDGDEYLTAILYMAPADNLEGVNVCAMAEVAGCKAVCLYTAGRGKMNSVQAGRLRKTMLWRDDRQGFIENIAARYPQVCQILREAWHPALCTLERHK